MKARASFEPGAKIEGVIPLCVPEIRGNEWQYVRECLDTGWVSSVGSFVTDFEKALAGASGLKHGVATVNGTAALHTALLCAGVERDDEVLVSTLTFIAPANAIRYLGAHPVFIDAEPEYWQMDPNAVRAFLTQECSFQNGVVIDRATGRRVKAIVPVDILGSTVDFDEIAQIARAFGLAIVEDATESLGARYKERPVGSRADIACFSFNGNKLLTTGGGGMIVTDDDAMAKRARYLTTQAKDDPIEYVHAEVGFNYRLTNVLAAIGLAQMEKLDEYVAIKRANAARYAQELSAVEGIGIMPQAPFAFSTFWLYTILVDERRFGMSSRALLRHLAANGVQARPLWQPMHRSPAHRNERSFGGAVAERLCDQALSLPSSVGLLPEQLEHVVEAIRGAARA
jgi:perosamine synthetase